jgi:hypothetical protein
MMQLVGFPRHRPVIRSQGVAILYNCSGDETMSYTSQFLFVFLCLWKVFLSFEYANCPFSACKKRIKGRKARWNKKKDLFGNSLSVDSVSELVDFNVFVKTLGQLQGYLTSNEMRLRTWLCKEFVLNSFPLSCTDEETGFSEDRSPVSFAIRVMYCRR